MVRRNEDEYLESKAEHHAISLETKGRLDCLTQKDSSNKLVTKYFAVTLNVLLT